VDLAGRWVLQVLLPARLLQVQRLREVAGRDGPQVERLPGLALQRPLRQAVLQEARAWLPVERRQRQELPEARLPRVGAR
jgi:hypothetical protein